MFWKTWSSAPVIRQHMGIVFTFLVLVCLFYRVTVNFRWSFYISNHPFDCSYFCYLQCLTIAVFIQENAHIFSPCKFTFWSCCEDNDQCRTCQYFLSNHLIVYWVKVLSSKLSIYYYSPVNEEILFTCILRNFFLHCV